MNVNNLKDTRFQLQEVAAQMLAAAKKAGRDLTREESERVGGITQAIRLIENKLDGGEALAPPVVFPGSVQEHNSKQPNSALRNLFQHATIEEREQIGELTAYLSGRITAVANLTPGADGGYLIPSIVQSMMERNYAAFAPVISVARLFATDTGEPVTYPVLSDSESAVQLAPAAATGADATVTGDTPPTALTGPKLGSWKVSSKPVFINREIISDGNVDIVTEVLGALLARVIRYENLQYTSGDGTTEAEGFLTNCSIYHAGSVALDLDVALDLAYSLPLLYRPNGAYMLNDTTAKYLRKLKTGIAGDKRQLWADADATKGTPATLHGYPVVINNDMDSVATDGTFTGKSPLAFGDFKRFVVRQAEMGQGYMYRYTVPAKDGQAVIVFRRSDSKLLVPEAIAKLNV